MPVRALALIAALLVGCATPGLPPDGQPTSVTEATLEQTRQYYLWPDRMDRRMLVGAFDALETRYDSVRFEAHDAYGILSVGEAAVRVPLPDAIESAEFRSTLASALRFVERELGDDAEEDAEEGLTVELVALRGALGALDTYSTIFSGRSTEDFEIRFSGKLSGIGARVGRRDGHFQAVTVFPGSPAERGGLKDGDAILRIDGDSTQPLSVSEAVSRIRGPAGSQVLLHVQRGEQLLDLRVVREEVDVPTVEAKRLKGKIAHARIFHVSRLTAREFQKKVEDLGELRGLILDLRGNTGGSMLAAASVADLFLPGDTIVRVVNRAGSPASDGRDRVLADRRVLFTFPVVVLVDPTTASAAEILSGALAPLEHVTVVGQRTFGKGLIQRVMSLPEENLLKLTVAEYLLSGDRVIHEQGVAPDLELYPVSTEDLAALAKLPAGALPYLRKPGEDDVFPIEVARAILTRGRTAAVEAKRAKAARGIREALAAHQIRWSSEDAIAPDALSERLRVSGESLQLEPGRSIAIQLQIENPNDRAIPDAWLALSGPAAYLANRVVPLGTIPAGGRLRAEVPLEVPAGLSAADHPVELVVLSGATPLHTEKLVLHADPRTPALELEIVRTAPDRVAVRLVNRDAHPIQNILVQVPGNTRVVERLEPGAPAEVEVLLAGEPDRLSVGLPGSFAERRILVPVPEERIRVSLPRVSVRRGGLPGRPQLRLEASAEDGLDEGWIFLDGQKEAYAAWDGRREGKLRVGLDGGEHDVTTLVRTLSGVAIVDLQHFPAN